MYPHINMYPYTTCIQKTYTHTHTHTHNSMRAYMSIYFCIFKEKDLLSSDTPLGAAIPHAVEQVNACQTTTW